MIKISGEGEREGINDRNYMIITDDGHYYYTTKDLLLE